MTSVEQVRHSVKTFVPPNLRNVLRPLARRLHLAAPPGAWDRSVKAGKLPYGPLAPLQHSCNVCEWVGSRFATDFHCEMATCPRCGSIARDRFLLLSFFSRTPLRRDLRVLETSPRLGDAYRRMMRRSFSYTACDFDLSAHEGDIRIDLQDIDLPDSSIDILLTPHVLEHVPDTSRALDEIFRVLAPGGRMYLQVPLCRGTTTVPTEPEFHADNTPVFFNFGWDLTGSIRSVGFDVTVLVTEEFAATLNDRNSQPAATEDGFDVVALWNDVRTEDLTVLIDRTVSDRLGILPGHQYATWECVKPLQ